MIPLILLECQIRVSRRIQLIVARDMAQTDERNDYDVSPPFLPRGHLIHMSQQTMGKVRHLLLIIASTMGRDLIGY